MMDLARCHQQVPFQLSDGWGRFCSVRQEPRLKVSLAGVLFREVGKPCRAKRSDSARICLRSRHGPEAEDQGQSSTSRDLYRSGPVPHTSHLLLESVFSEAYAVVVRVGGGCSRGCRVLTMEGQPSIRAFTRGGPGIRQA